MSFQKTELLFQKLFAEATPNDKSKQGEICIENTGSDIVVSSNNAELLKYLFSSIKPKIRVWDATQGQTYGGSPANASFSPDHINQLYKYYGLNYTFKDMKDEIKQNGNQLNISLSKKLEDVSAEAFKNAYQTQYKAEFRFFRNPFSYMKKLLSSSSPVSIEQIRAHAKECPKSRTAKVLTNLELNQLQTVSKKK